MRNLITGLKSLDRANQARAVLIISLVLMGGIVYVNGPSSPSITRTVAGGAIGPCTWFISMDGTTPVAEAMVGGLSVSPGDNVVGTAGQSFSTFWNSLVTSNIDVCFGPGIFTSPGGISIVEKQNITIEGIYKQTVIQCSSPACTALDIGNRVATDTSYHAQNIIVKDVVLDGARLSNSACLGISTSLNIHVEHVILQNCFEQAAGCLQLTTWNNQQVLNKNIFFKDDSFVSCKLGISGIDTGFLKDSVFTGPPPVGSTRYLVDWSKGDITPVGVNMVSNFCFCGNSISGWDKNGIFSGFLAVNNDTIAGNTITGAASFSTTVDTSFGVSCSGQIIADNFYTGSSGGMKFGYCSNLTVRDNIFSLDNNPGAFNTAFTFVKSLDPVVNTSPTNVIITGNTINKWGGVGMVLGFTNGLVQGNNIYDVNQFGGSANSVPGFLIDVGLKNVNVLGNTIVSDTVSGAGKSRPVSYLGAAKNDTLQDNFFFMEADTSTTGGIFFGVAQDPTFIIRNNRGYDLGLGSTIAAPCTYEFSISGLTYTAQNCLTGTVVSSTTFSTVWNTVLASNELIYMGPGTYVGCVNIKDVNNVVISGSYPNTIISCNAGGGLAINIGDQAAVDTVYHAQNVTLRDLVLDASSLTNSACLGVATSLNVYINHVRLQNCYLLSSGCFRVSNWNNQQVLNKNVFLENSDLQKCKVQVSGLNGGYIRNTVFTGLAPGASGSTPLVDFAKGDISPIAVNMLSNFCFCNNIITGWTGYIFSGFQAINNDTIANNNIVGAGYFIRSVDVANPILNGLKILDNSYVGSTGSINIGYGSNVLIRGNTMGLDTSPSTFYVAFVFEKSQDPTANSQPTGFQIIGNTIYKWGCIAVDAAFTNGVISNNYIYNSNQGNQTANNCPSLFINANLLNVNIFGNTIISDVTSGPGKSRPVLYNAAAKNDTLTNNFLFMESDTTPGGTIFFTVSRDPTFIVRYNRGYVTESQGSCSISSAKNCTVTHGLAGTPTSVLITAGTNSTGTFYVSSVGTTTFIINTANLGNFTMYWEAKFW